MSRAPSAGRAITAILAVMADAAAAADALAVAAAAAGPALLRAARTIACLATCSATAALAADAVPAARNTRHALVIAIGDYADPEVPRLAGTVHDLASARRMAAAMAIPEANIRVLRDRDATGARIRAEIAALERRVQDGDRVFVYYSGHGTRWYDEQSPADGCTEGLLASDGDVLSNVEMGRRLAPLARRSDKMLVFYDACFSGGVARAPFRTRDAARAGELVTPKFTRAGAPAACAQPSNYRTRSLALVMQQAQAVPQNVVHIAAARPDEVSFDSSLVGGFATVAWRDCLLGQAQDLDGSGAITVDEVTRCAQARVTSALAGMPGILGQQLTVAGNAGFVPAWMGAAFGTPSAAAATATAATATTATKPPAASGTAAPVATATTLADAPPLPAAPPAPAADGTPSPATRPATPAELLAELHAQRDGSRRIVATVRQPVLRIGGDTLQLDVTSPRDGHLYVALAGSDGRSLTLLYPNALATDNRVRAGQRVSLPGPGWEVVSGGPPGAETLLVLVTDAPRDLSSLAREPDGPFTRTLLDAQGRARLQSVFANGTPSRDCGQAGRASCSDAYGAALLTVQSVR